MLASALASNVDVLLASDEDDNQAPAPPARPRVESLAAADLGSERRPTTPDIYSAEHELGIERVAETVRNLLRARELSLRQLEILEDQIPGVLNVAVRLITASMTED